MGQLQEAQCRLLQTRLSNARSADPISFHSNSVEIRSSLRIATQNPEAAASGYTGTVDTSKPKTVSDRDRDYIRRWGEWKLESHAYARKLNRERPPRERQALLLARMRRPGRVLAGPDDYAALFYAKADELGLRIRP